MNMENKEVNRQLKVNIVTVPERWVLRMMAENWSKHIPNSTITNVKPCLDSDINFYVNWNLFSEKTNIDVGWFTHRDDDSASMQRFASHAMQMDYCICPSQNTLDLLPKGKSCILKHGVPEEYSNQKDTIKFGILGRGYSSGRKNFDIVEKLKTITNASFTVSGGKLSTYEVIELYKDVDYLLVTATNEGGPVPVIEAFTMGVPVIAPDVGWCWEYPVIKYSNPEELFNIVSSLCSFVDVDKVWKDSSEELLRIVKELC